MISITSTYTVMGTIIAGCTIIGIFSTICFFWLKDKFVQKDTFEQHITAHSLDITSLKNSHMEAKYEIQKFADKIDSLKDWISERFRQQDTSTMKELIHINNNIKQYVQSNESASKMVMALEDKVQEIEVKLATLSKN